MKNNLTQKMSVIAIAGIFAMLSACDSGGTASVNTTAATNATGQPDSETDTNSTTDAATIVANDFTFPEIAQANDAASISIPAGPIPAFSARRILSSGSGNTIAFGDPVVLKYNMYSWSSGAIVESTDNLDEPITVSAGVTDGIPEYLSKSLLGRNIGDKLQIVFESGMHDLPEYLDPTDAYVIVVELI